MGIFENSQEFLGFPRKLGIQFARVVFCYLKFMYSVKWLKNNLVQKLMQHVTLLIVALQ